MPSAATTAAKPNLGSSEAGLPHVHDPERRPAGPRAAGKSVAANTGMADCYVGLERTRNFIAAVDLCPKHCC